MTETISIIAHAGPRRPADARVHGYGVTHTAPTPLAAACLALIEYWPRDRAAESLRAALAGLTDRRAP